MKKATEKPEIGTINIKSQQAHFCVLGTEPVIYEAMSNKAKGEIVLPGPKTKAARAERLKHEPLAEYRESVYQFRPEEKQPTLLFAPCGWFKKGCGTAALRVPGASKTEILQLLQVKQRDIPIYGVPQLSMMTVRCKDMDRTPDIRTRAILPEWACEFDLSTVTAILQMDAVAKLLALAGVISGAGGFRPEKGGEFGRYEIVAADDPRFLKLKKDGGRAAQAAALLKPKMFDVETERQFRYVYNTIKERRLTALLAVPLEEAEAVAA